MSDGYAASTILCRVKHGVRPRPRHQLVCRVPSDSRFPFHPTHNFQQQDPLGCGWAVDNLHWERIFALFGGMLVFWQGRVSVTRWESSSRSRFVQCRRNRSRALEWTRCPCSLQSDWGGAAEQPVVATHCTDPAHAGARVDLVPGEFCSNIGSRGALG